MTDESSPAGTTTPNADDDKTASLLESPPAFADLGVPDLLCERLTELGIKSAFPVQALTIPDALKGLDVCGQAKTGSGKTLAFGLPTLARIQKALPNRPTALALVPTRELALQVAGVLEPLGAAVGARVVAVYGGAAIGPQQEALNQGVEFVVATPGRLIDLWEQKNVRLDDIKTLVIDEADRMADLGFMPQVEWLLRKIPDDRQTLLFSATLDGAPGSIVKNWMRDPVRHELRSSLPTVATMAHRFLLVHQMDKAKVAAKIISHCERTIVFCATKRNADQVAKELQQLDITCAAIHGDRRQSDREKALARFTKGDYKALVATDVAARGIDVEGIDCVIHYDPPMTEKDYLHRSGRTARAGQQGLAVSLIEWNQRLMAETIIKRLSLGQPIVELYSNDLRLEDLTAANPNL